MYRFTALPLYILADVTGLVAWVDYLPVKEERDGRADSYDAEGSLEPPEVLEDITGLTEWVDYVPAYVSAGTTPWVDYLPVHEVASYSFLLETGTDKVLMESSGFVLIE
jgi:hypothetical protein